MYIYISDHIVHSAAAQPLAAVDRMRSERGPASYASQDHKAMKRTQSSVEREPTWTFFQLSCTMCIYIYIYIYDHIHIYYVIFIIISFYYYHYYCCYNHIYIYTPLYIYIQPYIHVIYFVGTHMYYMLFGWVSHLPVRPCDAHLDWIPSNGANPLTHRFFWVLGGSSNLVLK